MDSLLSKVIHHGKAEHSNMTQGSYTASARSLTGRHFKANDFADVKKHKETGNTLDLRRSEDVQQFYQLRAAENSGTLLSGEVWAFMEDLQPKSLQHGNKAKRFNHACKPNKCTQVGPQGQNRLL